MSNTKSKPLANSKDAWKTSESFLENNAEDVSLNKGAKKAAVRALEQKLSVEPPRRDGRKLAAA